MSFALNQGTQPSGIEARVLTSDNSLAPEGTKYGSGGYVEIGDYRIPMKEFLRLVEYTLMITNVEGTTDPRVEFVERVRTAYLVDGYPIVYNGKRQNPEAQHIVLGSTRISAQ